MARTLRLFLLTLLALVALPSAAFAAGHNITISASLSTTGVSSSTVAGTTTFTATSDGAVIKQSDLITALGSNNVVVSTGSTGGENGDILFPDNFIMNSSITTTLDLQANNDIVVNGSINRGGLLKMEALHDIALNVPASMISTDSVDVTAINSLQINTLVWTTGSQTWTGPASVSGGVTANADITFKDNLSLAGDFGATATSGHTVNLQGTVDGAHQLNVTAGLLNLSKDIGATTPLTALFAGSAPAVQGPNASLIAATTFVTLGGLDISGKASASEVDAPTFNSTTLTLGGNQLTVNGGGVVPGVVSGAGGKLVKDGTGMFRLLATNTYSGGTQVLKGTFQVEGTSGSGTVAVAPGATLTGYGTTGTTNVTGGTVSPGVNGTDPLTTGALSLDSNSHLQMEVNGAAAGDYDQIAVTSGGVALGNASLGLTVNAQPAVGSQLVIVDNQTANPVAGTFAGLPEGSTVTAGGVSFSISYAGGDGNDVVLTVQKPTPAVTLTCGPEPLIDGAPVDCTVTVSGPGGAPVPTGNIVIAVDGVPGSAVQLTNGAATVHYDGFSAGVHSFRASYAGDGNYTAASSITVEKTVGAKSVDGGGGSTTTPPADQTGTPQPTTSGATTTIAIADARGKAKKRKPSFITFVVTRSGPADQASSVRFTTKNGTARAGRDFKAAKGTLRFAAGVGKLTIKVALKPLKGKGKKRRFSLVLSAPQGATLTRSVAIGTISP